MSNIDPTDTALFSRMAREDERWLGHGYLGARLVALDTSDPETPARPDEVADADESILERVEDEGWTYEELFAWANSKDGRWFGDVAFGSGDLRAAMRYLRKQAIPCSACGAGPDDWPHRNKSFHSYIPER